MKKRYWIVSWLEKWKDGTVLAFRTAVHCETLARAAEVAGAELDVRAKANKSECLLCFIGLADDDAGGLVGKAEVDGPEEWPE